MTKGSKGNDVKLLQIKLNAILNTNIVIDGHFGDHTQKAVKIFQSKYKLKNDGIVGNITMEKINHLYSIGSLQTMDLKTKRFVIFVDAGHGGISPDGNYTTKGKRAYHPKLNMHDGKGNYYEGYENRIAAELFIEKCTQKGIQTIRTYHPYKDTPLAERVALVKSYLNCGYFGYMHSFHSNAIPLTHSEEKLRQTRGFMVFTTKGNSFSDEIAENLYDNIKNLLPDWRIRAGKDGQKDHEANFYILRNLDIYDNFGTILEEFGFHTSDIDCQFIINNREARTDAALKTAIWTKEKMTN